MSDPRSPPSCDAAVRRNPVLRVPAAQRLRSLPPKTRQELAAILRDLALDARTRADESWRRNKAPMAGYWKAVGVYAGHLRRVVRPGKEAR